MKKILSDKVEVEFIACVHNAAERRGAIRRARCGQTDNRCGSRGSRSRQHQDAGKE